MTVFLRSYSLPKATQEFLDEYYILIAAVLGLILSYLINGTQLSGLYKLITEVNAY
jgi:hypothetical protein